MTLDTKRFCHYAECRVMLIVTLNAIMLNVVVLSVAAPSVRLKINYTFFLRFFGHVKMIERIPGACSITLFTRV